MTLSPPTATADGHDTPIVTFSGFGTLGVARSSEDQAEFTPSIFKPNGAGHARTWSADVDSLFAAQLTATLAPRLRAVLQVISEQNPDNTWRPHVEWANVMVEFTPDFNVRAGRTVLGATLLSDSRKVGYSFPWVRPPIEVYRLLPITNSDGLDASYRTALGEWVIGLQGNAGQSDTKLVGDLGTAEARHSRGLSLSVEHGAFSARITSSRTDLTIASVNALFDAFRQFGPQGIAIADRYSSSAKPFGLLSVGASYEPGQWFVMGEWAKAEAHSFQGKRSAWYASGGYRFDKFTPYFTCARARADNLSDPGLDLSSLPPSLIGPAAGLNAVLDSVLRSKTVQDTVSVGGRWDFAKNAALKVQLDYTRIGAGSNGTLTNLQPGFVPGGKFNVFSATLNYVF